MSSPEVPFGGIPSCGLDRSSIAGGNQPAAGSAESGEPWELAIRDARAGLDLFASVADALAVAPTAWLPSLLGLPSSWGRAPHSEFNLVSSRHWPRLLRYLMDIGIPSIPGRAPAWVHGRLRSLFWHPSCVEHHPDENGKRDSHQDEAWFFINGILTTRRSRG
jgi:hypothetical protein